MRPEFNSRRLFGITRSRGKMFELGLPEALHIAVPVNSEPQELFVLTVGTLGDAAAFLSDADSSDVPLPPLTVEDLNFSASFFDAFLESKFEEGIARDTALLAASAYYLARRPGSSLVLARRIVETTEDSPVDKLLRWALQSQWASYPNDSHSFFGVALGNVARLLAFHFHDGSNFEELTSALNALRRRAYEGASSRELLFIDIIVAIIRMRLAASAWTTLPGFTGISAERWATAIRRPEFPKELWPSQVLLGRAGFFSGTSGIVQMPTSAGKTRSVEIVLRSGFLSERTKLAVVVAPFRALCHEIGTSLRHAFREDDVKVNELSDAMQLDFLHQVAELLGSEAPTSRHILVLTPEKLLYVLRQTPAVVADIGMVIYDEGHQFDSGSRGITYELLLTEIKTLLPTGAQTVLVSAVIQNAQAIGKWLIGDDVQVVNGNGLLPTARSVAFSSWIERLGQLMFFESNSYTQPDYFVPRVIEQQTLARRRRERTDRYFPIKNSSNDVALYLGIRLVPQGAVAIFCGRKDTASGMAARVVDIYDRGFGVAPPAAYANLDELRRMKTLVEGHFGEQAIISRAASMGVFVHHGTTPHGLRLSIEYAMQLGRINFVACTSTLAQGVNLPIRYLIVSGIHQGAEKIRVRDFQNLIGRAGRSGMHTEGLVIFSDPEVFDKRLQRTESWKFNSSVELLSPVRSDSTTSSLLALLAPFRSSDGKGLLQVNADALCRLLFSDESEWLSWANEVVRLNPQFKFGTKSLVGDLRSRRRLILAIESYLMANRGVGSFNEFKSAAESLAASTLAYHLASDELKPAIKALFISVAEYVHDQEPATEKQAVYSKTLLGVRSAKAVEQWVTANHAFLLTLDSNEDWLAMVWSLFSEQSGDKFFHAIEPDSITFQLATRWLQGSPYFALFAHARANEASKPWGAEKRRRLTDDEIVDFCENTLGFECSLLLAAVAQFLFGENSLNDDNSAALTIFQKALKYGLPDWLSISCYEQGFSDRVLAQHLCGAVRADGFLDNFFASAFASHQDRIEAVLTEYPSYFESVLASRGSRKPSGSPL
ncbi:DEAD/DEAH box helicase [Allopusillimonas ginsengisoli]|nr:DEAD/DEAH box helicase [Allopusillimonas ginsengisoli]